MGLDCQNVEVVYIKDSLKWAFEKFFFFSDSESYESEIITNFEADRRLISVKDIRGFEESYQLNKNGFCIKKRANSFLNVQ